MPTIVMTECCFLPRHKRIRQVAEAPESYFELKAAQIPAATQISPRIFFSGHFETITMLRLCSQMTLTLSNLSMLLLKSLASCCDP